MVEIRFDSFRLSKRWLVIYGFFGFFAFRFLVRQLKGGHQPSIQVDVQPTVDSSQISGGGICDPDPPPNWDSLYRWEDNLPQHNVDLPSPEGKTGRYLLFRNQNQLLGWNNVLTALLMDSYLAYKSNRTYVFRDYMWSRQHYPWKHPDSDRLTPLNALIGGPTAGGPWDPTDPFPRSISSRFWDNVCPPHERKVVNTRDVKPAIYWEPNGRIIFETWQKLLLEAPERCIEIQPADWSEDKFAQTFDLWFWGGGKCNDLWDEYRDSPISRLLKASPIVESAVARNAHLLSSRGPKPPLGASSDSFDRMIAIHLRRGDYEEQCMGLAQWNATFYAWNLLHFLPDKFPHPPGWDVDRNQTIETYLRHCYPTPEIITNKIRASKQAYIEAAKPGEVRHLDTVFIMTNDKTEWVDGLTKMLYEDGWGHVASTRQLELDPQQKEVGMAVDMEIARRASVFIGNGWSSFSSNIVHQRLVDHRELMSCRFF